MRPSEHGQVVAEERGVVARVLHDAAGVREAVALLDELESQTGVPVVDEAERARLSSLAVGREERPPHWHPLIARWESRPVGYAGLVLPVAGVSAVADLAVDPDTPGRDPALRVLLPTLTALAADHGAGRLLVWVRRAVPADVRCARSAGLEVRRRLAVMGRPLTGEVPAVDPPEGVTLRSYRPGPDDDGVVAVLAGAYEGRPEGGWDHDRFAQRRQLPWFDPADLLLAEGPGGDVWGLHWTKRRGGGVGEVYNLAVAPAAQGRGLGRVLLLAGLRHLRDRDCREVLLWVDRDNAPAAALYASHGFTTRWEDIAFSRELAPD